MRISLSLPGKRTWIIITFSILFIVCFTGFFWYRARSLSERCYQKVIAKLPQDTKEKTLKLTQLEHNLLEVYITDRHRTCIDNQKFFFIF